MSHSSTSLRGTTRRRRRARRIGSPAVRRLRPQGAPQVDALAVAPPLVPPRAPQRRAELEARHQPVELRELVGLERVEALLPQQLLVACSRDEHLELGLAGLVRRRRRRADGVLLCPVAAAPAAALPVRRAARRRPALGSGTKSSPCSARPPKIEKNTESNVGTWAWSETSTARAVQ